MPELRRRWRVEAGRRRLRYLAVRALTWFSGRYGAIVDPDGALNEQVALAAFAKWVATSLRPTAGVLGCWGACCSRRGGAAGGCPGRERERRWPGPPAGWTGTRTGS